MKTTLIVLLAPLLTAPAQAWIYPAAEPILLEDVLSDRGALMCSQFDSDPSIGECVRPDAEFTEGHRCGWIRDEAHTDPRELGCTDCCCAERSTE